jgi:CubicO group peptidase (beta-lactamase class C family)
VAIDTRIVYSKASGTADLENGVPATTATLIRTASIAKPITAAAALTLVEAGKLDLDAPVQEYCAPFPAQAVAHHHSPTAQPHFRHPPLQRRRTRKHTPLPVDVRWLRDLRQ